jgi:Ni/Co efflux regulator RcnB
MRFIFKTLAVSALAFSFSCAPIIAQEHHDDQQHRDRDRNDNNGHRDHYVRHEDWRRGQHMRHEDWDRGRRVDNWRAYRLRRPPRGYEWRDIDGQYVLGNSGGVIFQVVTPR